MRITYFVKCIKLVIKEVINTRSLDYNEGGDGSLHVTKKSEGKRHSTCQEQCFPSLSVFLFHFNDIGKSVTHPLVNAVTRECLLPTYMNRIKTTINRWSQQTHEDLELKTPDKELQREKLILPHIIWIPNWSSESAMPYFFTGAWISKRKRTVHLGYWFIGLY